MQPRPLTSGSLLAGTHRAAWRALIAACLLISLPGEASEDTAQATAEVVVRESGMAAQLIDLPRTVITAIMATRDQLPLDDEELKALTDTIAQGWDGAVRSERASEQLTERLTDTALTDVARWYESELAGRIVLAESALQEPGGAAEVENQATVLLRDAERVDLARRVLEARGSAELLMNLQRDKIRYDFELAGSVGAPQTGAELKTLLDDFEAKAPHTRTLIDFALLTEFLYAHRELTITELQAYAHFAETDASRSVEGLRREVYRDAWGAIFRKSTRSVLTVLATHRSQSH